MPFTSLVMTSLESTVLPAALLCMVGYIYCVPPEVLVSCLRLVKRLLNEIRRTQMTCFRRSVWMKRMMFTLGFTEVNRSLCLVDDGSEETKEDVTYGRNEFVKLWPCLRCMCKTSISNSCQCEALESIVHE
jgi:hypothetical protein